jgi:molybdate transport system regulatory protein
MKARAKLFLSAKTMEGAFGEGKWRLLKAVQRYGSIQRAARSLGRSYRKAWGDIKRAEEGLGRSLVRKSRGGAEGGSTVLTEFGRALLGAWDAYRRSVEADIDKSYRKHLRRVVEGK